MITASRKGSIFREVFHSPQGTGIISLILGHETHGEQEDGPLDAPQERVS